MTVHHRRQGRRVAFWPSRARDVLVALCATCVVLFSAELGVTWWRARPQPWPLKRGPTVRDSGVVFYEADGDLGYALHAGAHARSRLYDDDGTIYDVTYHVDSRGLRITPSSVDTGTTVAFFGCSYTFGEGLEDHETLPSAFAVATARRHRVLNLALSGYGPHQMLRAIEVGRYDSLFTRPAAFVYLAVAWQVERASGRTSWDDDGPRYTLVNGEARYVGTFGATRSRGDRILQQSALASLVRQRLFPTVRDRDLRLFVAILRRAHSELKRHYGVGLTVLFLSEPAYEENLRRVGWSDDSLADAIRAAGITVISAESPTPPADDPHRYRLRRDGHPTAAANRARADSLLRHLDLAIHEHRR